MRQRGFRHAKVTVNICLKGAIPLLVGNVFQLFLTLLVGRIVDENVQAAEVINRRLDSLLTKFFLRNVTVNH